VNPKNVNLNDIFLPNHFGQKQGVLGFDLKQYPVFIELITALLAMMLFVNSIFVSPIVVQLYQLLKIRGFYSAVQWDEIRELGLRQRADLSCILSRLNAAIASSLSLYKGIFAFQAS
jgi:hypothetical protein